jgi:ribosome-binding protein aMBF1 (putative translation factor)
MIQIDPEKVKHWETGEQHLTKKYGSEGSPSRIEFEAEARAWYYSEILRGHRKELHMTQKELADRIGKKRSYISKLERGETDMQLSTFLAMAQALGLQLDVTAPSRPLASGL